MRMSSTTALQRHPAEVLAGRRAPVGLPVHTRGYSKRPLATDGSWPGRATGNRHAKAGYATHYFAGAVRTLVWKVGGGIHRNALFHGGKHESMPCTGLKRDRSRSASGR